MRRSSVPPVFGDAQKPHCGGPKLIAMTHTPYSGDAGQWLRSGGPAGPHRSSPPALPWMPAAWLRQDQFHRMRRQLRGHGGLLRVAQVRRLLGPAHALEAVVAEGVVLDFHWMGDHWMPGFQFDAARGALRTELLQVYAELPGSYDAWDTVHWFAAPNAFLRGDAPVTKLDGDHAAVLAAARAEHFVVNG